MKDIPVGLAHHLVRYRHPRGVDPGMAFYGQHPDTAAIIGMAVIASGIVIMNLFSKWVAKRRGSARAAGRCISGQKSPTNRKGTAYV